MKTKSCECLCPYQYIKLLDLTAALTPTYNYKALKMSTNANSKSR